MTETLPVLLDLFDENPLNSSHKYSVMLDFDVATIVSLKNIL